MPIAPEPGVLTSAASMVAGHNAYKARSAKNKQILQQIIADDGGSSTNPIVTPTVRPVGVSRNAGQTANVPRNKSEKLLKHLQAAGFKGEGLRKAYAVAMRESGGRPDAFNGNAATGDRSYGLFQINMIGNLGKARMKQLGLSSYEDLLDPLVNARAAFKMTKGGKSWGAWDIDEHGYNYRTNRASWQKHYDAYMKFYNAYPGSTKSTKQSAAARAVT